MLDRLHRPLRDLRISVTDRCNMRCRYCMPREVYGSDFHFLPRGELLSFEEIARAARLTSELGVAKIRLTGGEPLLRRDLERLVELLARVQGIGEIALTTNGLLLARRAQALAGAGLTRVTVSLDALDPATLRAIGDSRASPQAVLAAIDAAAAAGLGPVKVNMVVLRGVNDEQVLAMAEHFRHTPHIVRFIEYMDVGSTNGWRDEHVLTSDELVARIGARWPLQPLAPSRPGEVARRYRYLDGAGEIGLVSSISQPFCGDCNRARLTSDGKLFTCLFARRGHDLRALLRDGSPDAAIKRQITSIWGARDDRYSERRARERQPGDGGEQPAKVEMSYVGG